MTTTNTSATEVSFRVRPLGFDRAEVQAFIGNLLNDYAQVTRTLERLRQEMSSLRDAPERRALPESTAREVERILAGAERIAEEVRTRADDESAATLQEAATRAADTLREAEARGTAIVDSALQKAAQLDRQTEAVRFQLSQMRNAIKSAAEAAAMALGEISAIEDEGEPALAAPESASVKSAPATRR
jgi:cell division septum initiation protein DivIVA